MCFFRLADWAYDLRQTVQLCGLIPVCTISCFLRFARWANDFSQTLHLNGFSPGKFKRNVIELRSQNNRFIRIVAIS